MTGEHKKIEIIRAKERLEIKYDCPVCKTPFDIFLYKDYSLNKALGIFGECEECGFLLKISRRELDLIQPSNPLFKKVYGYNPYENYDKNKEEDKTKKEEQKIKLQEKYFKMRKEGKLKPWELDFIEKAVIQERIW